MGNTFQTQDPTAVVYEKRGSNFMFTMPDKSARLLEETSTIGDLKKLNIIPTFFANNDKQIQLSDRDTLKLAFSSEFKIVLKEAPLSPIDLQPHKVWDCDPMTDRMVS